MSEDDDGVFVISSPIAFDDKAEAAARLATLRAIPSQSWWPAWYAFGFLTCGSDAQVFDALLAELVADGLVFADGAFCDYSMSLRLLSGSVVRQNPSILPTVLSRLNSDLRAGRLPCSAKLLKPKLHGAVPADEAATTLYGPKARVLAARRSAAAIIENHSLARLELAEVEDCGGFALVERDVSAVGAWGDEPFAVDPYFEAAAFGSVLKLEVRRKEKSER